MFDLLQACKCPICRRLINLLVPAALSEQEDDPQAHRILGEIQHYNCIFGGAPRSLTQVGPLSMKSGVFTILSRIKSTLEIGKSCCMKKQWPNSLISKVRDEVSYCFKTEFVFCFSLIDMPPPVPNRICICLGNHLSNQSDYCTCALGMVILMERNVRY